MQPVIETPEDAIHLHVATMENGQEMRIPSLLDRKAYAEMIGKPEQEVAFSELVVQCKNDPELLPKIHEYRRGGRAQMEAAVALGDRTTQADIDVEATQDLPVRSEQPRKSGLVAFSRKEIDLHSAKIPEWKVTESNRRLYRSFPCQNFDEAMEFVNRIASLVAGEDHRPIIHIYQDTVDIELTTRAARGLTENDFTLATKIDALMQGS